MSIGLHVAGCPEIRGMDQACWACNRLFRPIMATQMAQDMTRRAVASRLRLIAAAVR